MKVQKPSQTQSTFTSDKEVKRLAGYSEWNKENAKDISIALYDVDYAVKWQLENVIQPTVTEQNAIIQVPVLFASGEKWAAIQKHGYLRDNQAKILTPLIMIRRSSISKREDIQDLKVLETADARITFERKYTKQNKYDRFSLSQNTPVKEYYSVDVPKYVQVEYELLCWTNNTSQLNEIVEQLIWFDGKAFGNTYKFITHIDPPTFETMNNTGEDRLVRATMSMRTKAYILNTHGPNAPSIYKLNPVNRLVLGIEMETSSTSTAPKSTTATTLLPPGLTRTSTNNSAYNSAMLYLNSNIHKTGTFVNSTTVTFASGWADAPYPLPATSATNNFIFFANGSLIEQTAITSFTQSGNVSTLVINESALGYGFESSDEIIAIGKFAS
jgi:hypothetical protein